MLTSAILSQSHPQELVITNDYNSSTVSAPSTPDSLGFHLQQSFNPTRPTIPLQHPSTTLLLLYCAVLATLVKGNSTSISCLNLYSWM